MKNIALIIALVICFAFTSCDYGGYDFVDTNYHFDEAIISIPDGTVVSGKVISWSDAEDGEQLTITIECKDGVVRRYLCSSYNCVLIEDVFK